MNNSEGLYLQIFKLICKILYTIGWFISFITKENCLIKNWPSTSPLCKYESHSDLSVNVCTIITINNPEHASDNHLREQQQWIQAMKTISISGFLLSKSSFIHDQILQQSFQHLYTSWDDQKNNSTKCSAADSLQLKHTVIEFS